MKILFVYPNVVKYPKHISVGIAYLSAMLKKHGHNTSLIDTTFGMKDSKILSKVKAFAPDLVAVSCVSANFPYATHVATIIKKENKVPIIVGGIHPTADPEEALLKECFDMVCIGEGEDALLELVTSMEKGYQDTSIQNIWFNENGKIIRNGLRNLRSNLDELPYPDLDIYDYPKYLRHHNMVATAVGSRGCPYLCTYCFNAKMRELYKGLGSYVRYRSVDDIICELKSIVQQYKAKRIELVDDTFTLNKARVKEFCEKYKKEVGIPFHINVRVDQVTEDMCVDLYNAGCVRVAVGIESGDPSIRRDVLKRNISDEQILEGCRLIKKHGIQLYTYNMIGIPDEKMHNIRKTIALNRKIRPDFPTAFIFNAYKGTTLYKKCQTEGILDETLSYASYFHSSNVRHPYLSARKLRHIRRWFGFYVFSAYNRKRALINLVDRHFINTYFYSRLRTLIIKVVYKFI